MFKDVLIHLEKNVSDNSPVGGLAGVNQGAISNSYSNVNIIIDESNAATSGLFCGHNGKSATISGCFAFGKL